jgi:LysM repeat protein
MLNYVRYLMLFCRDLLIYAMSSFLKLILFGIPLILGFSTSAQQNSSSGNFLNHTVKNQETVYSLAKEYDVTPEDIYHYNPTAKKGIKSGEIIRIPKNTEATGSHSQKKPTTISYIVNKGESLYFIAKKCSCTQEDILKLNPGLSSIKKGMSLIVPNPDYVVEKINPKSYFEYRIQGGDTYYNLNQRFGAGKEDLDKINPNLKDGIKTGMVILIPRRPDSLKIKNVDKEIPPRENIAAVDGKKKDQIFNIGLYLPFCFDLNDSLKLASQTANYLEFYEGAMIASEDMSSEGMKLKMYTYDTNQDPKAVEQLVKKPEFLSLDLIVGPVYPNCQKIISPLSAKNRIPMVSPLSSDSHLASANPYYYQINPDKNLRLKGTVDYIIQNYKGRNLICLSQENDVNDPSSIPGKLKQKLAGKVTVYDLWSDSRTGIESLLNAETDNIIILTETDEARISVAITRLNTVAKRFKITLIGLQEYTRMKSINIEYLHDLKLHYLSPYCIDYNNKNTRSFIAKFRSNYSAEPNQYAYQGYDVMIGFLTSLWQSGRKFIPPGSSSGLKLLQADYNFQRVSNFGGYINSTFFIVEYNDSYDVHCSGKINATLP